MLRVYAYKYQKLHNTLFTISHTAPNPTLIPRKITYAEQNHHRDESVNESIAEAREIKTAARTHQHGRIIVQTTMRKEVSDNYDVVSGRGPAEQSAQISCDRLLDSACDCSTRALQHTAGGSSSCPRWSSILFLHALAPSGGAHRPAAGLINDSISRIVV